MSLVFNLIWILTGGWITALAWLIQGLLFCVTIIGIPFGRISFRMARLTLAPFGKEIEYGGGMPSFFANIIWLVLGGLALAVGYLIVGIVFCLTIVGIPFGVQLFKMSKLSLMPFGARIE